MLYFYNDCINQVNDANFYIHNHISKFYRTPGFDLKESARVINNTSHLDLKRKMVDTFRSLIATEKKEKAFSFTQKFDYNESFVEKEKTHIIENMKKDCIFHLNLTNKLLQIQNHEAQEYAV